MSWLLLARHAEAAPGPGQTEPGRFSTGDEPLSERGRRQARRLGRRIAKAAVEVDAVHASTAVRCRETAELVAEELPGEREIRLDEALLEIPYAEPGDDYASILATIGTTTRKLREDPDPTLANGASFQAVTERFADAIERIREAHQAPLVVAHGAQNRAWLAQLLGMPPHRMFALAQSHACLNAVAYANGRPVVEALNATPDPLEGVGAGGEG